MLPLSRQYIIKRLFCVIAWSYIAVGERDFCSQLIDHMNIYLYVIWRQNLRNFVSIVSYMPVEIRSVFSINSGLVFRSLL